METKRLWKRDSQFYPEFNGRVVHNDAHIRETVLVDIAEINSIPVVTRHSDDTYDIHDIVQWGHIRMNRTQAELVYFRLGNALKERR